MRDTTGAAPREAEAPTRGGRVPPEVLARRRAAERAVTRLTELKVITETVGRTAYVLIRGAWPCATGRLVNTTEANYLAALRNRSTSALQKHVQVLEEGGWVRNCTLANGARGSAQGVRFGIDVSGLIERLGEVEDEAERRREAERAKAEARALLKPLKGRLRRLLHCPRGAAFAERTAELLASIPRRFTDLTLGTMRSMIEAAERLLGAAEGREPVDNLSSGSTKTSDRARDLAGPTDTPEDESNRKGPAGENRTAGATAPENEAVTRSHAPGQRREESDTAFDIRLCEAMALVPEELRTEVEETYGPDGPRGLWLGLGDAAAVVWHRVGGDEATRRRVMAALGPQQGAVLLLLVAARAERSGMVPVHDVSAYATGCATKAIRGAFMWGSGLRSAVGARGSPVRT